MQGHLNKIGMKQGNGANGPWTLYSIEVDGTWYGSGFKAPNAKEGDYISFDVVQKGQYKNAENIAVSAGAPATAAPTASGGAAPVNKRDISIHYQSCRKDALVALGVLLQHDAVKLPAKQADKFDAALALVDEMTNQFYLKLEDVIAAGGVQVEDTIPSPGEA
jgi:hypothetical protein